MSNFSLESASARPPGSRSVVSYQLANTTSLIRLRNLYATITYYPSLDLDKQIQDIFAEELQPIKDIIGFSPNVIFQPLYEAAVRAGRERGGSALGIEAEGPLTSE